MGIPQEKDTQKVFYLNMARQPETSFESLLYEWREVESDLYAAAREPFREPREDKLESIEARVKGFQNKYDRFDKEMPAEQLQHYDTLHQYAGEVLDQITQVFKTARQEKIEELADKVQAELNESFGHVPNKKKGVGELGDSVKEHVKKNKKAYLFGGGGVVAGIAALIWRGRQ